MPHPELHPAVVVIPARGGSRSVPRKNLRPAAGASLIERAVATARAAFPDEARTSIVVSSDSPEALEVADLAGALAVERSPAAASDDAGVALALADVLGSASDRAWMLYQPTAVGATADDLRRLAEELDAHRSASLARPLLHQLWVQTPAYNGAVYDRAANERNRQLREPQAWEELGVFAARSWPPEGTIDAPGPLYSADHSLVEPAGRVVDVDHPEDLAAARHLLGARRFLFRVSAGPEVGSGHLHRSLAIADELPGHECVFDLDAGPQPDGWRRTAPDWALAAVESSGHRLVPELASGLAMPAQGWAAVLLDELDPSLAFVADMTAAGVPVVALEARGPGAAACTAVVNELYPPAASPPGALCGPEWAVLRPSMRAARSAALRAGHARWRSTGPGEARVLLTFGGTDPAGLTARACAELDWLTSQLQVVIPPGADPELAEEAARRAGAEAVAPPAGLARLLLDADLVVCSAGRTANEAAAVGCPAVTIAANVREAQHTHAPSVSLGLHSAGAWPRLTPAVSGLLADRAARSELGALGLEATRPDGAERVAGLLLSASA